ncbi:hypothetical protein B0H63DRAFT_520497 [Podospora didyma]|uniref:Uncharacterized protein n=1 Tax=Podospora didyma TaxID=330526 RepID=A0AAE0P0Z4_9PEZI|nr:hypothetical protein B0H63DRAFT_520497 [Podospora didyma]
MSAASNSNDTKMPQTSSPEPMEPTQIHHIETAGLSKDLLDRNGPVSPTSPHVAADAARAMSSTSAWSPQMNRRQSWSAQEYKHKQQMTAAQLQTAADAAGFSERGSST